jgi:hypothetical protein
VDTPPQDPAWRAPARRDRDHSRLLRLVAAHTVDPDLAALLWLMVEAHVPLLVAAPEPGPAARATLEAFLDLLPPATARLDLRGERESFDWLADAAALGWPDDGDRARGAARRTAPPETTYLVTGVLGPGGSADTRALRARTVVRALQRGYGLGAVVRADSLEGVLGDLAAPPAGLSSDELRRIGIVAVLRRIDDGIGPDAGASAPGTEADLAAWRVAACHYVRPLERDAAGHLQRRPPAILATWDSERDAYEHFAWGVTAELAMRAGYSRDEFEREHLARTRLVAGLVACGRASSEARHDLPGRRPGGHEGDTA